MEIYSFEKINISFFLINKGATRKEKFYLYVLIMKHKQTPEVFLPQNKMRKTYNNNQISSFTER